MPHQHALPSCRLSSRDTNQVMVARRHEKHTCAATCERGGERRKTSISRRSTRLRSVSFAIMASAMWWCHNLDKCVPVAGQEQRCPAGCNCYEGLKLVSCESKGLRTLPLYLPNSARKLTLANNNIMEVRKNAFRQLVNLVTLKLNDNRIRLLPLGAFAGLENLKELDLSGNRFALVPRAALSHLQGLKNLSLRNNPIKRILAFDFVSVNTLAILDIGELHWLNDVSEAALEGLGQLENLQMDLCNLEEVPRLRSTRNLDEVNLASNNFPLIRSNSFTGLDKMKHLSLAYCDIRRIEESTFRDLGSLRTLDLSFNNLTTLSVNVFPVKSQISKLYLEGNPWLCNCDLLPLAGYLAANNICSDKSCGQCKNPSAYNRRSLSSFSGVKQLPCSASIVRRASPPTVNASEGQPVKVQCPNKDKATKVTWFKPDGTIINSGKYSARVKIISEGDLNFTHITLKDMGVYKCSVTHPGGVLNATVFINVTQASFVPKITSTFSTTTIITKTPQASLPKQNPPPPAATLPATKTTGLNRNRDLTQSISQVGTDASRFLFTTAQSAPVFSKPTSNKLTTTYSSPSDVKADDDTKIFVGSFVALAILTAILLFVFHKYCKGRSNRRRRGKKSAAGTGKARANSRVPTSGTNANHQNTFRQKDVRMENPPPRATNMPTSWSSHETTGARSAVEQPKRKTSKPYNPNPGVRPLVASSINTFVLPPAPFREGAEVWKDGGRAKTFSTLRGLSQDRHDLSTNSLRFKASTLPPKSSAGILLAHPSSRRMMRDIAASCQAVALQRRSVHSCLSEGRRPQLDSQAGDRRGPGFSRNNVAAAHHRSCENFKSVGFARCPKVDADNIGDIDFTGTAGKRESATERRAWTSKGGLQTPMKNLEGLQNRHKETEI